MLEVKCRLCSSECALISLSGGKSRKNRDYIRKLVELTVGIKFEKDDLYKYICYPCTVQVYNFHIFKTRSIENEELLEAHVKKDEKLCPDKIKIIDLDDVDLPDINELQNTLAPWLSTKLQLCEAEYAQEGTVEEASKRKTEESSTQCDTVQSVDTSTQCCLEKEVLHKSTQNDLPNLGYDKYIQCEVSNVTIHTQTNGILTKSTKTQCYLMRDALEKSKNRNKDSAVQTDSILEDKATQQDEHSEETDWKCHIPNLGNIKREPHPTTPLAVSPMNGLNLSLTPRKNSSFPSISSLSSPVSNNLLAVRDKSQTVIICEQCDQTFYTRTAYNLHKKSHLVCNFCKKKFPRRKRTQWHIENECEVKKLIKVEPVVRLTRVEHLKMVQQKYSKSFEDLKSTPEVRSGVRMRSRSTSSVDSLYSCCSFCRNSLSVLHSLKLGIDKAVQTNLFDNRMPSNAINTDVVMKTKITNVENVMSPAKKRRFSQSPRRYLC